MLIILEFKRINKSKKRENLGTVEVFLNNLVKNIAIPVILRLVFVLIIFYC